MALAQVNRTAIARRLAVALVVACTGACTVPPPQYLEPWQPEYPARFEDPRVAVLAQALLAGSNGNTQPWSAQLDPQDAGRFFLYMDATRLLPASDPVAREAFMSQGAFLQLVRVAAGGMGLEARFELFPSTAPAADGRRLPTPAEAQRLAVASVSLHPGTAAGRSRRARLLYTPVTNRQPYRDTRLSPEQRRALAAAPVAPEVEVRVVSAPDAVAAVREVAQRAAAVELALPRVRDETRSWRRIRDRDKQQYRDGLTLGASVREPFLLALQESLMAAFPPSDARFVADAVGRERAALAATPAFVVIATADNTRAAQLRAGQQYAALALQATELGLSLHPVNRALHEYAEMDVLREQLRGLIARGDENLQMLLRIGHADAISQASPRRDVDALLGR